MLGKIRIFVFFLVCSVPLMMLLTMHPVQGGKPSPPLSLRANFEPVWYDITGKPISTTIKNDAEGILYVDTMDTKKVKYGVEVKYYPPGSWNTRGYFEMKVDQAGVLGRFVKLHFNTPATGPNCESDKAGCSAIDPFEGGTGTIETRLMKIMTQIVLVENSYGELVRDVDQPIGMEKMKTGDSKIVGLDISFTPDDPNFDYNYELGQFTNPEDYIPGLTCQGQNFLWGPAELYCVAAGQAWEFRPCAKAYFNEPDNCWRLLQGTVLLDYMTICKLRKWHMPFVLRLTK